MFLKVKNILQYQALISERQRRGGGTTNEEIMPMLTHVDQLALTYLGYENASGKIIIIHLSEEKNFFFQLMLEI